MSGGPYRPSRSSERVCIKVEAWPELDRRLWLAALAPTDPFSEGGGARAGHRPISNRNVARGYGRWLTFLNHREVLDPDVDPADRIKADVVIDYIRALDRLGNKGSTILARLEELGEMAKIVGPMRDWSFVNRVAAKVRARPKPPSTKQARLVGSDELVALGFSLMAMAAGDTSPRRKAILFRDGLIVALLALRPLRLKNLAELSLGSILVRTGAGWMIILQPEATKTHVMLEFQWPQLLVEPLDTYLGVHRPVLLARNGRWRRHAGDRLWVSTDGSPLCGAQIYLRVRRATGDAFGRAINPHLFRDAAATTLAIHDPARVRLAASCLGHRSFGTTERFYNQATTLEAHREYAAAIRMLRR